MLNLLKLVFYYILLLKNIPNFTSGVEKKYLGGLISPRPRCNSGPRNTSDFFKLTP